MAGSGQALSAGLKSSDDWMEVNGGWTGAKGHSLQSSTGGRQQRGTRDSLAFIRGWTGAEGHSGFASFPGKAGAAQAAPSRTHWPAKRRSSAFSRNELQPRASEALALRVPDKWSRAPPCTFSAASRERFLAKRDGSLFSLFALSSSGQRFFFPSSRDFFQDY